MRRPLRRRRRTGIDSRPDEVAGGERVRGLQELGLRPAEHDLAAALARPRPQLDDVIRRVDELAVVLDDHDGVAGLGELPAEVGEPRGVARMEADGRLVQHVERADELRAQLVGQVDPLRLAARQGARLTGEREIAESDAQEKGELGVELPQDLAGDDRLPRGEGRDRRGAGPPRRSVSTVNSAMVRPATRTASAAGFSRVPRQSRADRLAAIAGEEDAHVQLVAVRLHLLEEAVDARELAVAARRRARASSAGSFSQGRRAVDPSRRAAFISSRWYQLARWVGPRLDRAVGEAAGVRSGTTRASSYLRTLPKPLHSGHAPSGWLNENRSGCGRSSAAPHPLQRKSSREFADGAADDLHRDLAAALAQRRLDRLGDAGALGRLQHDAIEDHRDRLAVAEVGRRRPGEVEDVAVDADAGEAAPGEVRPQLRGRQAGGHGEAEGDQRARARLRPEQRVDDDSGGVGHGRRAAGGQCTRPILA